MRWVALLVAALVGLGCRPDFPALEGQQLTCVDDVDCPERTSCHPVLLRCFDALPECATEDGLVPDGTPCGGGARVCLAGACARSECGDGVVDPRLDEECDGTEGCHASCLLNVCGDGIVLGEEVCDDGNTASGDGCRADCGKVEVCGDGVIDLGEVCDDGNDNPNDACNDCRPVTWTARVVAGRGPGQGRPLETPLPGPVGMARGPTGELYLSSFCQILRLTDGLLVPVAGTDVCRAGRLDADAPATSVQVAAFDIAVDPIGRVLFVNQEDGGFATVRRIELDGALSVIAGGGPAQPEEGVQASQVQLSTTPALAMRGEDLFLAWPEGVWRVDRDGLMREVVPAAEVLFPTSLDFDELGRLHLLDAGRVFRVEQDGSLTHVFGDPNGVLDAGVPATEANLGGASGLAARGELCTSALVAGLLRCVDAQGLVYDAAPPLALNLPISLFRDDDGALLISHQHRVSRLAGGVLEDFAGTGLFVDNGEGMPASSVSAAPSALAVDPAGRLIYYDGALRVLRRVELDDRVVTLVDDVDEPISRVRISSAGEVFTLHPQTRELRQVAGDALIPVRTFAAAIEQCGGREPGLDVAFDAQGRMLFIAPEEHGVLRDDGARLAGSGAAGSGGDALCSPTEIALDDDGDLFVLNSGEREIRRFDAAGNERVALVPLESLGLTAHAGQLFWAETAALKVFDDDLGERDLAPVTTQQFRGDGFPLAEANLFAIGAIAVSGLGDLYLAESNHVRRVSADLNLVDTPVGFLRPAFGEAARSKLVGANALVTLPGPVTYVADAMTLGRFDHAGGEITRPYGRFEGNAIDDDDRARYVGGFENGAAGIAFDGVDTLFISGETSIHAVTLVDPDDPNTWTVRLFSDVLARPRGLAYRGGRLVVADQGGHRVVTLDDQGAVDETLYGVEGAPGVTPGLLFEPVVVAVDNDERLFVADRAGRVLRVEGGVADLVLGDLRRPTGIAFDQHGNLLVTASREVLLLDPTGQTHTLFGAPPLSPLEQSVQCLTGVSEREDGVIDVLDRCLGFYIELRR